jgi:chromosome segregation ATPase
LQVCQDFTKLDEAKGADGNELNEFDSHRLLERFDETLTVIKMREALRVIDVDANGKMSLLEYLLWRYKKSVTQVENAPQGDNQAQVEAAQRKFDELSKASAETAAALEAQKREEAELKVAEVELAAADKELKAQQEAYDTKIRTLEAASTDSTKGVVSRNKAANELSQVRAEDPLPLRKAKITNEAAIRRVQKQKPIVAAAIEATQAKLVELEKALDQAAEELEVVKSAGGSAQGNIYWMERTMFEADALLPTARMKYDHKKPFSFTG